MFPKVKTRGRNPPITHTVKVTQQEIDDFLSVTDPSQIQIYAREIRATTSQFASTDDDVLVCIIWIKQGGQKDLERNLSTMLSAADLVIRNVSKFPLLIKQSVTAAAKNVSNVVSYVIDYFPPEVVIPSIKQNNAIVVVQAKNEKQKPVEQILEDFGIPLDMGTSIGNLVTDGPNISNISNIFIHASSFFFSEKSTPPLNVSKFD